MSAKTVRAIESGQKNREEESRERKKETEGNRRKQKKCARVLDKRPAVLIDLITDRGP